MSASRSISETASLTKLEEWMTSGVMGYMNFEGTRKCSSAWPGLKISHFQSCQRRLADLDRRGIVQPEHCGDCLAEIRLVTNQKNGRFLLAGLEFRQTCFRLHSTSQPIDL